ncbi:hypothetical protein Pr1d_16900 [Bythopirellula goksoeyrii]|uniref:Uncharacterized protein n=1 Tax=Bythopirellula goksoeyrii TaxID=1400387 RepID=A0A5B9QJS8_9BACT|nr:hypothetical protein Pr1d_16900 [Bythopirellula goksoeyrii]
MFFNIVTDKEDFINFWLLVAKATSPRVDVLRNP